MSENVFRNLLEEIQQKYDRILEGKDIKKIGSALSVLRYKKEKNKGRSFDISQDAHKLRDKNEKDVYEKD